MNPFKIVEDFEREVASFAGARYAVGVNTGTSAIFLSLQYFKAKTLYPVVPNVITLPAKTFISVPQACIHAGYDVQFVDSDWKGVYRLSPLNIIDGALRFKRGMYEGGLHCLSFHYRKHLPIGEGGMILTDDEHARDWLRAARYCGRKGPDYQVEQIDSLGWLCYMSVEKAARGLAHMQWVKDEYPDQEIDYPDLRKVPYFAKRISKSLRPQSEMA